MKYSYEQRIEKIYDNAVKLNQIVREKHITEKMLISDFSVQWMITTPLYNIGEHSYNLSKEFKIKHNDIQWNMMAGLRHRLVHDYDDTNWNIIANIVFIVFNEIPVLIKQIDELKGESNEQT